MSNYEVDVSGQPEILINDEVYILAPGIKPKRIPRWLVPIADWNAKKHPHPDYNFNLVCRVPPTEISPEPSQAENSILTVSEPILPETQIDDLAILALEPPVQPPTNGKNGHHAPLPQPEYGDIPDWLKELR